MWAWRYGVSVFFEIVSGHGEGPGWSRDEGRARERQGPGLSAKGLRRRRRARQLSWLPPAW
jgi:hypothetical protein